MVKQPAISADHEERIIYQSRVLPRIFIFYAFGLFMFLLFYYFLILIIEDLSRQRSFVIFSIFIIVPFVLIAVRDCRTSIHVSAHRIVRRSGILFRSEKAIDLRDVDTALLQRQSRGLVKAIVSVGGERLVLSGVHDKLGVIRTVLELTGNEPPPKVDDKFANYQTIHLGFILLGAYIFVLLCFLLIFPLLASNDRTMMAFAFILIFTLMPVGAGVGGMLGSVIAVLVFSYRLTSEDLVEIVTLIHSTLGGSKQSGASGKLCYLVYEKILSWRYDRKIVLPR